MRGFIGLLALTVLASLSCESTPSTLPPDPIGEPPPALGVTAVEPTTAFIGEEFVISGWGFGLDGVVTHTGAELSVVEWADSTVRAVARDWRDGPLQVTTQDSLSVTTASVRSVGVAHDVVPRTVEIGGELSISGLGFGDEPGEVLFVGVALPVVTWNDDVIRVVTRGLYGDEPLIVSTRDFGSVTTPSVTSIVPPELDITEYRYAWGTLSASLRDTGPSSPCSNDPAYYVLTPASLRNPELEWDDLSYAGFWGSGSSTSSYREEVAGDIEPSLALANGFFESYSWWDGSGDYGSITKRFQAQDIPLFRVEADSVEYRLMGAPVIEQVTAFYRDCWLGQCCQHDVVVREFSHPDPEVSITFTRD